MDMLRLHSILRFAIVVLTACPGGDGAANTPGPIAWYHSAIGVPADLRCGVPTYYREPVGMLDRSIRLDGCTSRRGDTVRYVYRDSLGTRFVLGWSLTSDSLTIAQVSASLRARLRPLFGQPRDCLPLSDKGPAWRRHDYWDVDGSVLMIVEDASDLSPSVTLEIHRMDVGCRDYQGVPMLD